MLWQGERHATVVESSGVTVQLHLTATKCETLRNDKDFLEELRSYGDGTWWKLLHCDGDGK